MMNDADSRNNNAPFDRSDLIHIPDGVECLHLFSGTLMHPLALLRSLALLNHSNRTSQHDAHAAPAYFFFFSDGSIRISLKARSQNFSATAILPAGTMRIQPALSEGVRLHQRQHQQPANMRIMYAAAAGNAGGNNHHYDFQEVPHIEGCTPLAPTFKANINHLFQGLMLCVIAPAAAVDKSTTTQAMRKMFAVALARQAEKNNMILNHHPFAGNQPHVVGGQNSNNNNNHNGNNSVVPGSVHLNAFQQRDAAAGVAVLGGAAANSSSDPLSRQTVPLPTLSTKYDASAALVIECVQGNSALEAQAPILDTYEFDTVWVAQTAQGQENLLNFQRQLVLRDNNNNNNRHNLNNDQNATNDVRMPRPLPAALQQQQRMKQEVPGGQPQHQQQHQPKKPNLHHFDMSLTYFDAHPVLNAVSIRREVIIDALQYMEKLDADHVKFEFRKGAVGVAPAHNNNNNNNQQQPHNNMPMITLIIHFLGSPSATSEVVLPLKEGVAWDPRECFVTRENDDDEHAGQAKYLAVHVANAFGINGPAVRGQKKGGTFAGAAAGGGGAGGDVASTLHPGLTQFGGMMFGGGAAGGRSAAKAAPEQPQERIYIELNTAGMLRVTHDNTGGVETQFVFESLDPSWRNGQ